MTYDAKQIANWFVERAKTDGKQFSIMSLLKLTYIAHGWYLETRDRPLFANGIEAWRYGPVIPDVYLAFRKQGVTVGDPVNVPANRDLRKEDADFLEEVYGIYGNLTAFQLSELTHVQGGPWDIASKLGGHYAEIPNDLIRQHYVDKRTRAQRV